MISMATPSRRERSRRSNSFLAEERALAVKDIDALQMLLRDKDALARAAGRAADDLSERLRSAESGTRKLRDEVAGLRDRAGGAETRLSALEKELDQRRRDLAVARQSLDDLEGEKRLLSEAMVRARAAALAERLPLSSSIYQDGGWRLLADGVLQPVTDDDKPFVAGSLPRGTQAVDLIYRPPGFLPGMALATLALVLAAVCWLPRPSGPAADRR